MRTTFESEGNVRGTDLLAALVALWRERASGTLQFSRSGATADFELAAGEILATSSSDPRFDTASILVRAGKLEASTLERLAAPEGADRALLALQAGILTRRERRWGEKIRAVEVLSDLLTWLDGDYRLFRTPGREPGEFRLPIPRLVLELFLRSRDRSLVLHHLGGVDVPLARAATFDAEFATFGLTADAESVVGLIDGKATAAEIASEAPSDAFAVEKLLAALVTLGLVHPEFAPGEPSETAGAASGVHAGEGDAEEQSAEGEEPEEAEERETEEAIVAASPGEEGTEREQEHRSLAESLESEPGIGASELTEEELGAAQERDRFEALDLPMTNAPLPPAEHLEEADLDARAPETGHSLYGEGGGLEAAGPRHEPAFDRPLDATTGMGEAERPRRRALSPVVWLLAVLAAGTAAVLWYRTRGPSAPQPAAAAAPAVTATATAPPEPAATPTLPPPTARAATASVPTAAAGRPRPTPRAPAAAKAAAAAPADEASRQFWIERARRDEKRLGADRKARYAIQLELACEIGSLVDAFKRDRPAGTMWVLTTPFQGRTCFRVLWGRYPTREAAKKALASAPGFFSTPKNRPAVAAVR